MALLIFGLVLFLGVHFAKVLFPGFRARIIAARGENVWKGGYTVLSLIGLVAVIWGYGAARDASDIYWVAPGWVRPVVWVMVLAAFILTIDSNVNGRPGHISSTVRHPMTLAVILWAAAHLTINGDTAAVILFGSFLVWSVSVAVSAYQRPVSANGPAIAPAIGPDVVAVLVGTALWLVFFLWGHLYLFGVSPY